MMDFNMTSLNKQSSEPSAKLSYDLRGQLTAAQTCNYPRSLWSLHIASSTMHMI